MVWGKPVSNIPDNLYPHYDLTADILKSKGIIDDFTANGDLRYTHRTDTGWDIYFVSNKTDKPVNTLAQFRTVIGSPELWDAVTGKTKKITRFKKNNSSTSVSVQLAAYESAFVVFAKQNTWPSFGINTEANSKKLQTLMGPWEVNFDPKWGGPASVQFDELSDWTKNKNEGNKILLGQSGVS